MEDKAHILVVDDDTRLRSLLKRYLAEQGFRVTVAEDAAKARQRLEALEFDLLVLDIMMPGESGLELTQSLRANKSVPILLLTAMDASEQRIAGLEYGADDYLTKPFEPRELVLRIQAILRRTVNQDQPKLKTLHFGGFSFDLERHELRKGDAFVHLTSVERALLASLARQAGEAVSRDALADSSPEISNQRTIDVQMTRLRRKIEENPKFPRYLQTARGIGYLLMPD